MEATDGGRRNTSRTLTEVGGRVSVAVGFLRDATAMAVLCCSNSLGGLPHAPRWTRVHAVLQFLLRLPRPPDKVSCRGPGRASPVDGTRRTQQRPPGVHGRLVVTERTSIADPHHVRSGALRARPSMRASPRRSCSGGAEVRSDPLAHADRTVFEKGTVALKYSSPPSDQVRTSIAANGQDAPMA